MIIDQEIIRELAQAAQDLLDCEEELIHDGIYIEPEHEEAHEYRSRMLYNALEEFNAAARLDEEHTLATSTTSPYA
jgi:hypothetical protein